MGNYVNMVISFRQTGESEALSMSNTNRSSPPPNLLSTFKPLSKPLCLSVIIFICPELQTKQLVVHLFVWASVQLHLLDNDTIDM